MCLVPGGLHTRVVQGLQNCALSASAASVALPGLTSINKAMSLELHHPERLQPHVRPRLILPDVQILWLSTSLV